MFLHHKWMHQDVESELCRGGTSIIICTVHQLFQPMLLNKKIQCFHGSHKSHLSVMWTKIYKTERSNVEELPVTICLWIDFEQVDRSPNWRLKHTAHPAPSCVFDILLLWTCLLVSWFYATSHDLETHSMCMEREIKVLSTFNWKFVISV